MGNPKTVRVEDGDGGCKIINEEDLDKSVHKIYIDQDDLTTLILTVPQLKEKLIELEIPFANNAKKADLEKLLADAEAGPEE